MFISGHILDVPLFQLFENQYHTILGHGSCKMMNVSFTKTQISRTRTLIILLGILLAFILTLNASSFYSAGNFVPKDDKVKLPEKPQNLTGKIHSAGLNFVKILAEKFTSLK